MHEFSCQKLKNSFAFEFHTKNFKEFSPFGEKPQLKQGLIIQLKELG